MGRSDLRDANLRNASVGTHKVDDISLSTEFAGALTEGAVWLDGRTCVTQADCPN